MVVFFFFFPFFFFVKNTLKTVRVPSDGIKETFYITFYINYDERFCNGNNSENEENEGN